MKWYDSYKTDDRFVKAVLKKFDAPHRKIHGIAATVTALVHKGEHEKAHALIDETSKVELQQMVGLFEDIKKASREASRRRIAMVLELEDRTLALDIDEVVAVENISKIDATPHQHTRELGISRVGRRDKDDALVLLMEELNF